MERIPTVYDYQKEALVKKNLLFLIAAFFFLFIPKSRDYHKGVLDAGLLFCFSIGVFLYRLRGFQRCETTRKRLLMPVLRLTVS